MFDYSTDWKFKTAVMILAETTQPQSSQLTAACVVSLLIGGIHHGCPLHGPSLHWTFLCTNYMCRKVQESRKKRGRSNSGTSLLPDYLVSTGGSCCRSTTS